MPKTSREGGHEIFEAISSQSYVGILWPFSFKVIPSGLLCKRRHVEREGVKKASEFAATSRSYLGLLQGPCLGLLPRSSGTSCQLF